MDSAQIEKELDDLETKLERLRAVYEQYFLGLEKLEPLVSRKEVERKVWVLRREQIRNTALRFRFQSMSQRYNTYQQYWHRCQREIEAGTFRRDVIRAAKRFGDVSSLTASARKRAERYLKLAEVQTARKRTRDEGPDELELREGDLEEIADEAAGTLPEHTASIPLARSHALHDELPPSREPSEPEAPPKLTESLEPAKPPAPADTTAAAAAPSAARLRIGFGMRPSLRPAAPSLAPPTQARPPPPHDDDTDDAPTPVRPSQRSLPPPVAPRAPPPPAPSAPAVAKPLPSSPALATPAARPPARTLQSALTSTPRPPAAAASTTTPSAGAATPKPDEGVERIYREYVSARQRNNESTQGVTLERLSSSLRAQAAKLASQHPGRKVDYEVVTKDGKTMIKPILR